MDKFFKARIEKLMTQISKYPFTIFLWRLREELCLSRDVVQLATGVSQNAIFRIENDRLKNYKSQVKNIEKLLKFYGIVGEDKKLVQQRFFDTKMQGKVKQDEFCNLWEPDPESST